MMALGSLPFTKSHNSFGIPINTAGQLSIWLPTFLRCQLMMVSSCPPSGLGLLAKTFVHSSNTVTVHFSPTIQIRITMPPLWTLHHSYLMLSSLYFTSVRHYYTPKTGTPRLSKSLTLILMDQVKWRYVLEPQQGDQDYKGDLARSR